MKIVINKYHLFHVLFSLTTVGTALAIRLSDPGTPDAYGLALQATAVLALLQLVAGLVAWCRSTGSVVNFYTFFICSYYMFTLGQSFLHIFGIQHQVDIYERFSDDTMLTVHVFSLCCLALLVEGGLLAAGRCRKDNLAATRPEEIPDHTPGMRAVGLFLFLLSVVPMGYRMLQLLTAYGQGGYAFAFASISHSSGLALVFSRLDPFFQSALLLLFLAYDGHMRTAAKCCLLVLSALYLLIGERTGCASLLLVVLILESYLDRSTLGTGRIKLWLAVGFLFVMIPTIGLLRNIGSLDVQTSLASISAAGVFQSVADTFATLGFSAFPLGKVIEIVPYEKDFALGSSYLYCLVALFPNIFGGMHVAQQYSALGQWLMDYLHMSYGPGFSFPAEAWFNFGWPGCLGQLAIGHVLARCMYLPKAGQAGRLRLFLAAAFFVFTITVPRRDFLTLLRDCVWYVLIPAAMVVCLELYQARAARKFARQRGLPLQEETIRGQLPAGAGLSGTGKGETD